MTSGGNSFNDLPENQLTKIQLGGKNVAILHIRLLHHFNTICARPKKTGHLVSREGLGRTAGQ